MSEKIYVRKIETWTISSASKPIEVNVDALRKCVPPYEGDSEQELVNYLQNEVWNEYDFLDNEHNKEVYGEDGEIENETCDECGGSGEFEEEQDGDPYINEYHQLMINFLYENLEQKEKGKRKKYLLCIHFVLICLPK